MMSSSSAHRSQPQRVLSVGQWLGTSNRITQMTWMEPNGGWVARDGTGQRYYQRAGRARDERLFCPDGLATADTARGCTIDDLTGWPPPPCTCLVTDEVIDMRDCAAHDVDCPWVHDICADNGGVCLIYENGDDR